LIFEDGIEDRGGAPIIRGGVLHKLVERLTYHKYADPTFVRTFLTTYRSFVEPQEFLTLLIERFSIPNPEDTPEQVEALNRGEVVVREDLKRFKREYSQPVQLRVLNVMRHWVENHFYDFERDNRLGERLVEFLDGVKGKSMRKWVESIMRAIHRQRDSELESKSKSLTFVTPPPAIEWHLTQNPEDFNLITLHPVEFARQLTLIESEMFRAVKPSELVGGAWTKQDEKEKNSPNLLRLIKFTNNLTYWYMLSVVECDCLEERVVTVSRIIDIMTALMELNNFNGVLSIVSAFQSASIYRLEHTFNMLKPQRRQLLDDCKELMADRKQKYKEKLHSINPPCVPFAGIYLTDILYIEDGNKDWLSVEGAAEDTIINFSKRRMVAQIIGEIQQYQNQPYCLEVQPDIKAFLLNRDPLQGQSDREFEAYLYDKSKEIEPRNKPPARNPPRFRWDLKAVPKVRHLSVSTSSSSMSSGGSGSTTLTLQSGRSEGHAVPVGLRKTISNSGSPTSRVPESASPPLSAPPLSPLSSTASFHISDGPPNIPPRHPRQSSLEQMYSSSAPTIGLAGSSHSSGLFEPPPSIPPRSPVKPSQSPDAPVLPPRSRPPSIAPVIPPRANRSSRTGNLQFGAPDLPPRKKP
jgi:son of sevenless-like protein